MSSVKEYPLVSVILPVFNREHSLPRAIGSVVDQTWPAIEIIVVDDCSTDGSAVAAQRACPAAHILRHEGNQGPAAARNTGIRGAKGKYVSFLDSDDLWLPRKIESQVELVESERSPETIFCATQTLVMMEGGESRVRPSRSPGPKEDWSDFLYLHDGFAQTNSFLLSRELALRVLFNPNLRQHEDSLFFLTAGAHGAQYRLVKEPLTVWHHTQRADRLGYSPNLNECLKFLGEAGTLLSTKARLGFEARYVGPLLFRTNPVRAVRLVLQAAASRAIRPRYVATTISRFFLSEARINDVRRRLRIRKEGRR